MTALRKCGCCGFSNMLDTSPVAKPHAVCYFMSSPVVDYAVICRYCGNMGPVVNTKEKAEECWNVSNR